MIDWLKKRLSPHKEDASRWIGLSEIIQTYWEANFDESLEYAKGLGSAYTTDLEGQKRILAELGPYYENDISDCNIPLSISCRRQELLLKDTEFPLTQSLARLGVNGAAWVPLYALASQEYGTAFYMREEVEPQSILDFNLLRLDGTWKVSNEEPLRLADYAYMTSRGRVSVNLAEIDDPDIIDAVRTRVIAIKPLHIVFDGFYYYIAIIVSSNSLCRFGAYLNKSLEIIYPKLTPKLDGSWALGVDDVPLRLEGFSMDGSHYLGEIFTGTTGVYLEQLDVLEWLSVGKEIEVAREFQCARLGERLLRLDGGWKLGENGVFVLGEAALNKKVVFPSQSSIDAIISVAFEVDYPASPAKLQSTAYQLDSIRRLDGTWALGGMVSSRALDGSWKLENRDYLAPVKELAVTKEVECGRPSLLASAEYHLGDSWALRLNGSWKVGARYILDGTWRLDGEKYLAAPRLERNYKRLDGSWSLGYDKRLDGSWVIGITGSSAQFSFCCEKEYS